MGMKWIYGRQDYQTLERAQENCYLMTNALGGFSSLTAAGSAARNDHAFLMACTHAPNNRVNMVHRLSEKITDRDGGIWTLSSQEFADGTKEEGYRLLWKFCYEDYPVWTYCADGVEVVKEAALRHGENTVVARYRVRNARRSGIQLRVTPFFQFMPKGEDMPPGKTFVRSGNMIKSEEMSLAFLTDGVVKDIPEISETYRYAYDVCDGRRETGLSKACIQIGLDVEAGEEKELCLVFCADEACRAQWGKAPKNTEAARLAKTVIEETVRRRRMLEEKAGFRDRTASFLVKSADQFIARRESTKGSTILAGFPFFEDWGRDTMIALPGVCIATHRYEEAGSILRTFAQYEKKGLMPNLFPEGKSEPMYNTADAALLFINCVWLLQCSAEKISFLEEMFPVMERIVAAYEKGTDFSIHMDSDGLICAGSGLDQVTWMDVRAGEILPTPRHGKPVEINAYWYNALEIMSRACRMLGKDGEKYEFLSRKVKKSFEEKFWMEERHCLKDVLSGTAADTQIRCNQIWALSMPFPVLEGEKARQVVDTVEEKLYTPYGLRTLAPDDPEFHSVYTGSMLNRDLAYHQGTVWVFPLGAFYIACLRAGGYDERSLRKVKEGLDALEGAMREGCAGQLPEIYDGGNPTVSKGCFAQAWSVGEVLRVYREIEKA